MNQSLPMVGRSAELAELRAVLDGAQRRAGTIWLVSGTGGVGKTRLGSALAEEAQRRDWTVASGRSFPVESGVPYALFADALLPVQRQLDDAGLAALTREVAELTVLFPRLGSVPGGAEEVQTPHFRNRLHWHFAEFLRNASARRPLLVVLEDLQWADTSSLELLHFVARHVTDAPLFIFCTVNPEYPPTAALRALGEAVNSLPGGRQLRLEPLTPPEVEELVCRAFQCDGAASREFAGQLYSWTRGNPFFIEETLKLLVSAGDLRLEDGRWTGWQVDAMRLPSSVRDAVLTRLQVLSPAARDAADIAATIGVRFTFEAFRDMMPGGADAALDVLDELRRERVLHEIDEGADVVYDFVHPLIRETLYRSLGRVRAKLLHARIAAALEERYGADVLEHADELAYHFVRAGPDDARASAVRYLAEAGRRALVKYANREAADYLTAALQRVDSSHALFVDLAEGLARARQRLGEYGAALELWARVRTAALQHGDPARAAAASRRMGLACYWSGDLGAALAHFEDGLGNAAAGEASLIVRLWTARAVCLQELGRPQDALAAARHALEAAGADAAPPILARVHRTFLQLYLWSGDAVLARHHGARALELAAQAGVRPLAFMAHWGMGVLEAFSGNARGVEAHLEACRSLADELRAPVMRVWSAELTLEFASARGDWNEALEIGEEAISTARALQQRTLLPRLLVWTALIHLNRGDYARGKAYVEEAWRLSGAAAPQDGTSNIHAVLAAHIGRTALLLNRGDYAAAARAGEEGVAIADRAGYVLWAVHRLLPMVAEAHLWLRDLDGARRTGERLSRDATRLGHGLGIGWAAACEACVVWLDGDSEGGAVLLRRAAEQLEALPYMLDATRLRRQLAGRLAETGQREAALCELRLVHERLLQLGAEQELGKARQQFREMGARPPARTAAVGARGSVTPREMGVAALVARRKSSKAIARDLQISVRTVDAHLTNIYRKLGISSRAELAELVRSGEVIGVPSRPGEPAGV
jgi:DNA-binding CsgD family transcriptional regulator